MKLFALLSALALALALTTPALAQEPTPIPLPYHFEPVDFDENAAPELPLPSVTTPTFINALGSYALTVFSLLDKYQVLGIFVVIMLGLSALWWLYSFVTDRPVNPALNVSGGLGLAGDLNDEFVDDANWRRAIRAGQYALKRGKKFRF
ncbi:MAG: hypothetical protein BroJett011_61880 [Chloroflexota bacterium]|nr:MAG: hypothetical protein BroJett011_61880 [Chloroflexota bacterium]